MKTPTPPSANAGVRPRPGGEVGLADRHESGDNEHDQKPAGSGEPFEMQVKELHRSGCRGTQKRQAARGAEQKGEPVQHREHLGEPDAAPPGKHQGEVEEQKGNKRVHAGKHHSRPEPGGGGIAVLFPCRGKHQGGPDGTQVVDAGSLIFRTAQQHNQSDAEEETAHKDDDDQVVRAVVCSKSTDHGAHSPEPCTTSAT